MIFEMLPFKVYYHCFYCRRGGRLFGKCDICSRFFVDDQDIAKNFDSKFIVTKKADNGCQRQHHCVKYLLFGWRISKQN